MINRLTVILYAIFHFCCTTLFYLYKANFTAYFRVDDINIIFLFVLSFLYFGISLYNFSYDKKTDLNVKSKTINSIFLLIFISAMTGVILSTHLAMLWIFVEATTLSSAYLIYYNHKKASLEASWKYIFICSIGISLAFIGIIFLTIGLPQGSSLFFDDLYKNAKLINPLWLKLSFVFILIGLGTKMGLSPVHAWLPDAHSEAPSTVSALLSGTLLNAAFIGILRFYKIMDISGLIIFANILLKVMGFLSIFVCLVFILKPNNYKRMLAYSSIENMGIIALGITFGTVGLYAALIQIVGHSLAKASLFLTSGNILTLYDTKNIKAVRGLLKKDNPTGWLWIFSFIFIAGLPPSPIFFSEFLIAKSFLENKEYLLLILFFIILTLILFGMARNIFKMTSGLNEVKTKKMSILYYVPQIMFLTVLVIIGLGLLSNINIVFENAIVFWNK